MYRLRVRIKHVHAHVDALAHVLNVLHAGRRGLDEPVRVRELQSSLTSNAASKTSGDCRLMCLAAGMDC